VRTFNPYSGDPITVVIAKDRQDYYFPAANANLSFDEYQPGDKNIPFRVLDKVWKGSELAGIGYEQLIPWVKVTDDAFKVVTGDFVTTDEGTGIVHIAPPLGRMT